MNYVGAVMRVVKDATIEPGPGLVAQVAIALLPAKRALLHISHFPSERADERPERLKARLEELRCPPVRGPVAFVVEGDIAGGSSISHPGFGYPFCDLVPGFQGGSLDELIHQACGFLTTQTPKPAQADETSRVKSNQGASQTVAAKTRSWLLGLRRFVPQVIDLLLSGRMIGPKAQNDADALQVSGTPAQAEDDRIQQGVRAFGPPWPKQVTIESLTSSIEEFPKYLPFYQARGELFGTSGRWDDALSDFEYILRFEPANVNALFARGICRFRMDQLEPALADFNATLRWVPEHVGALVERADIYCRLGAWSAAETDMASAIKIEPFEAQWYLGRARLRTSLGRFDEALNDANLAIEADPHADILYAFRGSLLLQRAKTAEELTHALNDFVIAATIAPLRADRHAACGDANLQLGRIDEAIADCERALSLDPQFGPALGIRGIAEEARRGPTMNVIRDCTAAIESGCGTTMTYMSRATAYGRQRDLYAALADFDKVLELSPDYAPAWNGRGAIRGDLELAEAAREDFERAIELAPQWSAPFVNRGVWFRQQGNLDAAIDDCCRALECDPAEAQAYLLRAQCRLAKGKIDLARQDFDAAVDHGADLAQAWCDRGAFLFRCGDAEAARADLSRALTIQPDFHEALYHRANVLTALHELDAALADLNRLISLRPELTAAYTGRGSIWLLKGEPERAQHDFDAVVQQDPEAAEWIGIHQTLVQSSFHIEQERFDDAIASLTELLDSHSDCLPAYRLRAWARWYSEQFVEAIDDYTWLIEHDEETADYFSSRGQVLAELGECDHALQDLNRALELAVAKQDSETLLAYIRNGRGLALAGLERRAEAIEEFEKSIHSRPQNAWAQFNLGLTYYRAGDLRKASMCFRLSLELNAPRLTPRKRGRARAFLEKMPE